MARRGSIVTDDKVGWVGSLPARPLEAKDTSASVWDREKEEAVEEVDPEVYKFSVLLRCTFEERGLLATEEGRFSAMFNVDVYSTDTISDLKRKVYKLCGAPPESQVHMGTFGFPAKLREIEDYLTLHKAKKLVDVPSNRRWVKGVTWNVYMKRGDFYTIGMPKHERKKLVAAQTKK